MILIWMQGYRQLVPHWAYFSWIHECYLLDLYLNLPVYGNYVFKQKCSFCFVVWFNQDFLWELKDKFFFFKSNYLQKHLEDLMKKILTKDFLLYFWRICIVYLQFKSLKDFHFHRICIRFFISIIAFDPLIILLINCFNFLDHSHLFLKIENHLISSKIFYPF